MSRRKPLHPEGGFDGEQAVADRGVEADDERPKRIVHGLRRQLACLDVLGQLGDELADVVHGQLAEGTSRRRAPAACGRRLVACPGARLEIWPPASEPAPPIRAERLLGVAHLAALDLLDQPSAGVAGGTRAGEAALGRLRPVAAPVDEAPADAVRGPVGVDAATAAVAGAVRAAGGGRDLSKSLVESAGGLLGGEPAAALPTVGVAPANLPAAAVKPDAHAYPQGVVRRWSTGCGYLSRDNGTHIAGRKRRPVRT